MKLEAGARLQSSVCTTQLIVVRAPDDDLDICCGGQPLLPIDADDSSSAPIDPLLSDGTLIGKRYVDDEAGIELLCTKAGDGSLTIGSVRMPLKDSKPLPSSD